MSIPDLQQRAQQRAMQEAQERGMVYTLASQIYVENVPITTLTGFEDEGAYESNSKIAVRCIQAAKDFHKAVTEDLKNVPKT